MRTLILLLILFLVSSCIIQESSNTDDNIKSEESIVVFENRTFGPVTSVDKENYLEFMALVSCNKPQDRLLERFNWTYARVVEIGRSVDQDYLSKEIFKRMQMYCPDELELVPLTYKSKED
jgi:hypothetical protein